MATLSAASTTRPPSPSCWPGSTATPNAHGTLSAEEIDEILALQGTGGPLTTLGVEGFVKHLERRRLLVQQINAISGTEFMDMLEQLVGLIYDKVQPHRDRTQRRE